MTYLVTMMVLLQNAKQDIITQERLDLARIECGMNQHLQLQLDERQRALNDAIKRNRTRIAEIAMRN